MHSKRIPKFSKTFPGIFTVTFSFGPEISVFLVEWKAPSVLSKGREEIFLTQFSSVFGRFLSLLRVSTNYFQRLTLKSWYTNLEQTPLNRCQQLPAPYKRLYPRRKSEVNNYFA